MLGKLSLLVLTVGLRASAFRLTFLEHALWTRSSQASMYCSGGQESGEERAFEEVPVSAWEATPDQLKAYSEQRLA